MLSYVVVIKQKLRIPGFLLLFDTSLFLDSQILWNVLNIRPILGRMGWKI